MVKTTCVTCGKMHFGKCLADTGGCYGCGMDGHKVRDCPTIAARRRYAKQVPPSVLDNDVPRKNGFYALRARGIKSKDDVDKLEFSLFSCYGFLLSVGVW